MLESSPHWIIPNHSNVLVGAAGLLSCRRQLRNCYWSIDAGSRTVEDAAWSYDYPTSEATGIAVRIAFYSERVEMIVDGRNLSR